MMRDQWISPSVLAGYPMVEAESGRIQELADPDGVWYVERGCVDVFCVGMENGSVATAHQHVLRAEQGALVFGVATAADAPLRLRARPMPGFAARRIPLGQLLDGRFGEALTRRIDAWVHGLTGAIVREIAAPPLPDVRIEADADVGPVPDGVVASRRGVVWIPAGRHIRFVGTIDTRRAHVPLTPESWAQWAGDGRVGAAVGTAALLAEGYGADGLAEFHRVALAAIRENRALVVADLAMLQIERAALRRNEESAAREALRTLASGKTAGAAATTELMVALQAIGAHERIDFRAAPGSGRQTGPAELADVLCASDVRSRAVRLPVDDWWLGDNGAMLGYLRDGHTPVALIPSATGRYRMVNGRSGKTVRMTRHRAGELESHAVAFYAPLPKSPVSARHVASMIGAGAGPHLLTYAATGVVVALIAFLPAVVLGLVVDRVAPTGDRGVLRAAIIGLVLIAFIGALVQLVQSVALMRAEGRGATRITAAFWNRILRLPSDVLRQYMTGDLAARAMSFQHLREAVTGTVANALTSLLFMLPAAGLLIAYEPALTVAVLGVGLVVLLTLVVLGAMQLPLRQRVLESRQHLNGLLYEFVNAIGRIQKASAMGSVFAAWAAPYELQKSAEHRANGIEAIINAVSASAPLAASAALLAMFAFGATPGTSIGDFLVVYAATTVFFSALMRLGSSVSVLTEVLSTYRQAAPLLSLTVEPATVEPIPGAIPNHLGGDVRLDHATFRYEPDGPLILDDVSIRCRPGEFVAIVGESGSGKSTVFRLLLGLDTPESGAVYYDGRNLSGFNLEVFRQRIGVVTQEATLMSGTILENIVGVDATLTEDDAWAAAELAAVADDIRNMPMGMNTSVGRDVTVLSGGQAQRLLIAGALVRKPRLLLLDEATNWLDNASQASVVASIERVIATRIVIAHRLTTIRGADRIYVMSAGKVVQEGSYDELAAIPGKFQDLVARQTA